MPYPLPSRLAPVGTVLILAFLAACARGSDGSGAARQLEETQALVETRQCGRALGIAVRCNLLRDERDYTAVREAMLEALDGRHGEAAGGEDGLGELLDLSALDRLSSMGACTLSKADLARVAKGVSDTVARCARP